MRKIREATRPFHLVWTDKFFLTNNDGSEHKEHPLRVLNKLKPYFRKNNWKKHANATWIKEMGKVDDVSFRLIINHPEWPGEVLIQLNDEDMHGGNLYKLFSRYVGHMQEVYEHPDFPKFWKKLEEEYRRLLETGHVFNLYGQVTEEDVRISLLFDQEFIDYPDMVVTEAAMPALTDRRILLPEFKTFDLMDYLLGPSNLTEQERVALFLEQYMELAEFENIGNDYIVNVFSRQHPIKLVIAERLRTATHLHKDDFPEFLLRTSGYDITHIDTEEGGFLLEFCRAMKARNYPDAKEESNLQEIKRILGVYLTEYRVHYFGRSRMGVVFLDEQDRVWGYCPLI